MHLGDFDHEHESLLGVRPGQLFPQLADGLDARHQVHCRGAVFYWYNTSLQWLELRRRKGLKIYIDIFLCGRNLHYNKSLLSFTWSTWTALSTLS